MIDSATLTQAKLLLAQARQARRLHAVLERGVNGENFNLFHLLGVGHLEVSTHSSLLRDLLDPAGSHGQGSVFLRHFVEAFDLPPLPSGDVKVDSEVGIGTVTETTGGRLDVVVSCGSRRVILIENKIYAAEQNGWVSRYLNHAPGSTLIYLTLDGRLPSNLPPSGRPANLVCRSYAIHVVEWIKRCRKEAATAPIVRESLSQYLRLLQELTQQNQDSPMNQELITAITADRSTLEAYFALRNVETELRRSLVGKLQSALAAEAAANGLVFKGEKKNDFGWKGAGFEFAAQPADGEPVRIRFEFDKGNYQDFAFGFADEGKLTPELRKKLKNRFADSYHSPHESPNWPAWIYWHEFQNWTTGNAFVAILDGTLVRRIMEIVSQLRLILAQTQITQPAAV